MRATITILFLMLTLVSCDRRLSREESYVNKIIESQSLFHEYQKAVAVIQNQYYHNVTFPNGVTVYFSLDKEGNLIQFKDENEANIQAKAAFGTGFVVSECGKIGTNRHVISPVVNKYTLESKLTSLYNEILLNAKSEIDSLYAGNQSKKRKSRSATILPEEVQERITVLQKILAKPDFDIEKLEIKTISTQILATFSDPESGGSEILKCSVLSVSEDPDLDLAILQINSFENKCVFSPVFDMRKIRKTENVDFKEELFMIGYSMYNQNPIDSRTLLPEIKRGLLEKQKVNKRIQYSINSLPGSSGSPIIDADGNLIAINFAKNADDQNISFGIPAEYLAYLVQNGNIIFESDTTIKTHREQLTSIHKSSDKGIQ